MVFNMANDEVGMIEMRWDEIFAGGLVKRVSALNDLLSLREIVTKEHIDVRDSLNRFVSFCWDLGERGHVKSPLSSIYVASCQDRTDLSKVRASRTATVPTRHIITIRYAS